METEGALPTDDELRRLDELPLEERAAALEDIERRLRDVLDESSSS